MSTPVTAMPKKPARRPGRPPASHGPAIDPESIGGRIFAARVAAGLSQAALAAMLDPPAAQKTIHVAETGVTATDELVAKVARALGLDPCDLDPRLAPANALTLARVDDPEMGVGWEPLRAADRAAMGRIWVGAGPASAGLGELADRAAADGIAVILRGDLPVRVGGDGPRDDEEGSNR